MLAAIKLSYKMALASEIMWQHISHYRSTDIYGVFLDI